MVSPAATSSADNVISNTVSQQAGTRADLGSANSADPNLTSWPVIGASGKSIWIPFMRDRHWPASTRSAIADWRWRDVQAAASCSWTAVAYNIANHAAKFVELTRTLSGIVSNKSQPPGCLKHQSWARWHRHPVFCHHCPQCSQYTLYRQYSQQCRP